MMIISILLACSAFASVPQYRITSQVISEGKTIASPRVVVNEGKTAELSQGAGSSHSLLKIQVTPVAKNGAILLKYAIQYHSGSINEESSQQILTQPKQEKIISIQDVSGKKVLLVKVTTELLPARK